MRRWALCERLSSGVVVVVADCCCRWKLWALFCGRRRLRIPPHRPHLFRLGPDGRRAASWLAPAVPRDAASSLSNRGLRRGTRSSSSGQIRLLLLLRQRYHPSNLAAVVFYFDSPRRLLPVRRIMRMTMTRRARPARPDAAVPPWVVMATSWSSSRERAANQHYYQVVVVVVVMLVRCCRSSSGQGAAAAATPEATDPPPPPPSSLRLLLAVCCSGSSKRHDFTIRINPTKLFLLFLPTASGTSTQRESLAKFPNISNVAVLPLAASSYVQ